MREWRDARALMYAADAAGLPARVGIASSKLAARVASGLASPPAIVPAGEEAAFLAPLPLQRLAPEVDVAETLERWGVRSVGDFARLPPSRIASRLGRLGRELHSTARGLDPRPLMPREPPPTFHEGMSLEWPLVALEPFLFIANAVSAKNMTPRAKIFVQIVTVRLLKRSARFPPSMENKRSIRSKWERRCGPTIRRCTRWNWNRSSMSGSTMITTWSI